MKIEQAVRLWTANDVANVENPATNVQRPAVVDRVERVGNGFERKISIHVQGLQVASHRTFRGEATKLELIGAQGRDGILYKVGYPELPVVRFFVTADRKEDIRIQMGSERRMTSPQQVSICQPSVAKSGEAAKEAAAVKFSGFYPPTRFSIEEAGTLNGQKQFLVTVHPVAMTQEGQLSVIPDFAISAKKPSGATLDRPQANGEKKTFAFVVGSKFADSPSLAAYKALKESLGFQVETIVVGRDANSPDEIRAALQELFHDGETDLQYALLVGDFEDVPAPQAKHMGGVTDHYYRAIDTNAYDPDINGPDIGVGRLPVVDEAQLAGVLGKLTRYSQKKLDGSAWQSKASFVATDDRWQTAEGSHNFAIDKYTAPTGLTGTYPQNPQPGGDKLYAITHRAREENLRKAFSEGRAIIDYSGHGATTYWAGPRFTQADVRALNHPDATPFVISNACITGNFRIPESFAETWIRHPQGAVLFWGSVDSTYWDEDDVLERAMFTGIYEGNKNTFAEITQNALREVWRRYGGRGRSQYYWETYTTFGDPSLELLLNRQRDEAPPATPADLSVVGLSSTECVLGLTAPGDDGMEGQARKYEVRYHGKPIVDGPAGPDEISFENAILLPTSTPKPGGTADRITLQLPLTEVAREIYVAVKAIDDAGNASGMVTQKITLPPAEVRPVDAQQMGARDGWGVVDVDDRTGVWTDSPNGEYRNRTTNALTTQPIHLAGLAKPQLRFDAKHELERAEDFVYVEVAEIPTGDAGNQPLVWKRHATFTGESDWLDHRIDLSAYAGKDIQVRFKLVSDWFSRRDGIYVDRIRVVGDGGDTLAV